MVSPSHTNLPSSHSINHLLLLLLHVMHGARRVLSLACNHPSFPFPTPVTCISVNKQHAKPQGKKHESEKKKKRKIFLRVVEEDNRRGIACRKDIKQGQPPNFSIRWGNLFEHFLPETRLKFIKLGVCIFHQIWALLKDSIRTKTSLFAGHCLSYMWLSLSGTDWDIARLTILEGEVQFASLRDRKSRTSCGSQGVTKVLHCSTNQFSLS